MVSLQSFIVDLTERDAQYSMAEASVAHAFYAWKYIRREFEKWAAAINDYAQIIPNTTLLPPQQKWIVLKTLCKLK